MTALLDLLALASPDFPDALCKSVSPELMTPDTREQMNFGKSICCKCSHKKECLERGVANREVGIWGGTDDDEREAMRKAMARLGATFPKKPRALKHVVGHSQNRKKVLA